MKTTHDESMQRQEELYSFLQRRGDEWTSMEQVTDSIKRYPAYFRGTYHNSRARRMLTNDIEAVNGSSRFRKVIISGNHGIKLATRSEFERFCRAEMREVFRKLKRVRRVIAKGSRDQQKTLEGEIVEAFLPTI